MQGIKGLRRPIQHTVFGYFTLDQDAETAVAELRESGFHRDQISVGGQPLTRIAVPDFTDSLDHNASEAGFWDRVRAQLKTLARRRQMISIGAGTGFGIGPEIGFGDGPETGLGAVEEIGGTSASVLVHLPSGSPVSPMIEVLAQAVGYPRTEKGVLVSVKAGGRREDAEAILEAHGADMQDYLSGADAPGAKQGKNSRLVQLYADALHFRRDRVQRAAAKDEAKLPKAS